MTKDNLKKSIGIILCIVGISIGGLIKLAMDTNYPWISYIAVILSLIALFDIRRLASLKNTPGVVASIFLYSIYTILLAIANGTPLFGSTISIIYQIVYFAQIIMIWELHDDFDLDGFLRVAFWIIGITSIATLILLDVKDVEIGYGVLVDRTEETNAVSRATTGFIAYYGLCTSLTYKSKNKTEKIAKVIFFIVSLFVMIMSSRRSGILSAFIISFLYFKNHGKGLNVIKVLSLILLFGILLVAVSQVTFLQEAVNKAWDSLSNGLNTYLGTDSSDMSAGYRRVRIESIPNEYLNYSTAFQFLFGRGYNTDWLDIPFLQAFWDLGLLGGIWFLLIQGIYPLKYIVKKTQNPALEFAQYYALFRVIQNFSNGTPYGNFLPIILLYTFDSVAKKTQTLSAEPAPES